MFFFSHPTARLRARPRREECYTAVCYHNSPARPASRGTPAAPRSAIYESPLLWRCFQNTTRRIARLRAPPQRQRQSARPGRRGEARRYNFLFIWLTFPCSGTAAAVVAAAAAAVRGAGRLLVTGSKCQQHQRRKNKAAGQGGVRNRDRERPRRKKREESRRRRPHFATKKNREKKGEGR